MIEAYVQSRSAEEPKSNVRVVKFHGSTRRHSSHTLHWTVFLRTRYNEEHTVVVERYEN